MTRIRIFIATTEGPVAVQKITAEDPDVPSVACRDGTTEVLAISRDYTRFVDRGTGLIAALTGHGAYRLDLDRPVDGGRSWQLPVLLAHLIEAEGRLASPDEPADLAVLATGEVDRDKRVRPVGRIGEKLAAARDLIARHEASRTPLVVLLPAADRTPEVREWLRGGAGGGTRTGADEGAGTTTVRAIGWERVGSLAALEEEPPGPTPDPGGRSETEGGSAGADTSAGRGDVEGSAGRADRMPDAAEELREAAVAEAPGAGAATAATAALADAAAPRRARRASRIAGALVIVLAAAAVGTGAAWWNGPRHWETLRHSGDYRSLDRSLREAVIPPLAERFRSRLMAAAPRPESLVFSLVEQRTADGRPCAAARSFRGGASADPANLAETPVPAQRAGFFRSERSASLCQAIYRITNEGERLVYLYFAVRPLLPLRTRGGNATATEADAASLRRAAALPPGASLALDLEFGAQPAPPLGADLLILAAPTPAPQLRQAFESATGTGDAWAAEGAGAFGLTVLPALGLTVKGASHAILR